MVTDFSTGAEAGWAVWAVCAFNFFLFGLLIASLPFFWRLRLAFKATARALNGWSEAVEQVFDPTPSGLSGLPEKLRGSRAGLLLWQRRLQFWQGMRRLLLWLKRRG
ncbi:MAG: hypothetical protein Q6L68_12020 [Thermostichus sp. DG02_5_bins_236]